MGEGRRAPLRRQMLACLLLDNERLMVILTVVAYGHDDCEDAGDDGMVEVAEAMVVSAAMRTTTLTMMTGPAYIPTARAVFSRSPGRAGLTATLEVGRRPFRVGSGATRYGPSGN